MPVQKHQQNTKLILCTYSIESIQTLILFKLDV